MCGVVTIPAIDSEERCKTQKFVFLMMKCDVWGGCLCYLIVDSVRVVMVLILIFSTLTHVRYCFRSVNVQITWSLDRTNNIDRISRVCCSFIYNWNIFHSLLLHARIKQCIVLLHEHAIPVCNASSSCMTWWIDPTLVPWYIYENDVCNKRRLGFSITADYPNANYKYRGPACGPWCYMTLS